MLLLNLLDSLLVGQKRLVKLSKKERDMKEQKKLPKQCYLMF